jgi:ribonuclease D
VPSTDAEFEAALAELAAAGVVGFDTESKPVFIKNEENTGPHVFQFSTLTRAFIFQLNKPACLPYLKSVLQSQAIVKVGFGLNSDRKLIHSKLGVQLEATVDVDSLFKRLGYRGATGVRSAIAIVFKQQFHKSKKISTSNWGASQLTPAQLGYAGNDAYAALRVWHGCIKPQGL